MKEYTIHELAALAGVSTRTLRWYHQIGLLRPCRVGENGYRLYTGAEVDRLQHILFYRALGVELAQIGRMLDDPDFDRMAALRGHLAALQGERARIDALIRTVRQTIQSEERNVFLMDEQKFECFKREAVRRNEEAHGREIRDAYGDEMMDQANAYALALSQQTYAEWKQVGDDIRTRLAEAVRAGEQPDGPVGAEIAEMHRRWVCFGPNAYDPKRHAALAEMYVADERFRRYYDGEVDGCARFLRDAVVNRLHLTE
ncbi:MAG: MerR family transcriptional regulator [Clostridia bacterium]|nr:MerR family transcriptional regulator [Clostridia bacterium]